jgi:hypothetical protein
LWPRRCRARPPAATAAQVMLQGSALPHVSAVAPCQVVSLRLRRRRDLHRSSMLARAAALICKCLSARGGAAGNSELWARLEGGLGVAVAELGLVQRACVQARQVRKHVLNELDLQSACPKLGDAALLLLLSCRASGVEVCSTGHRKRESRMPPLPIEKGGRCTLKLSVS